MALSLTVHHAQRRVKRPRIGITVAGAEWDGPYWADTWIDPITETLMLRPPALYSAWWTTNAGNYAKPAIGGYTLSNAAHFKAHDRLGNTFANYLLSGQSVAGAWAAVAIANKNRCITFSLGISGAGDDYIAAQVGWGAAGTPNVNLGVRLDIYAHGTVTCWRDGVYVGKGSLGSFANNNRTLLLLPCRKRELIVLATEAAFNGDGVTDGARFVFEAIDETDTNPTIVSAGQFYCLLPPAAEAAIQIVPMKFATTGYATSLPYTLSQTPPVGVVKESFSNADFPSVTDFNVFGHKAYEGGTNVSLAVVKEDGTAYVPDGVIDEVRLKPTLTGDGNYTPFIYGAHTAYKAEFVNTLNTAEYELLDDILQSDGIDIDVPDDPGGVRVSFTVVAPEAIETADVPKLRTIAIRPVKIELGTAEILDGLSEPMEYEHPEVTGAEGYGRWTWRNAAARLERFKFRELVPLDGMLLAEPCHEVGVNDTVQSALRFILEQAGFDPLRTRFSATGYRLDEIPGARAGDWNQMINVGDDAWFALRRLCDSHAQGFLWQFRPWTGGEIFEFTDPTSFTNVPHATVYESHEDAITEEAEPPGINAIDNIAHLCIENFVEKPIPIEGNEVVVTGRDPRIDQAIQAVKSDLASQDPAADPLTLPDNWLGFAEVIGITLTRLTSQEAIERACEAVYDAVTKARFGASWDGFMLMREGEDPGDEVPLWRGDLVEVFGRGKYRVTSMHIHDGDEPYDGTAAGLKRTWRRCSYVGVKTADGLIAPRGYGGVTLEDMIAQVKKMSAFGRLQEGTYRPPTNPAKLYRP